MRKRMPNAAAENTRSVAPERGTVRKRKPFRPQITQVTAAYSSSRVGARPRCANRFRSAAPTMPASPAASTPRRTRNARKFEGTSAKTSSAPRARALYFAGGLVPSMISYSLTRLSSPPGAQRPRSVWPRSEEHTSELQSQSNLVCRLLLDKKQEHTLLEVYDV